MVYILSHIIVIKGPNNFLLKILIFKGNRSLDSNNCSYYFKMFVVDCNILPFCRLKHTTVIVCYLK